VVDTFDLFVCTSHDEGLGLPLLEVQYAGLPVAAPDLPVFREVLGESGWYIHPDRIETTARDLAERLRSDDWRRASARLGLANVERWNRSAERDRESVVSFLSALTRAASRSA
jgi:glycosyltransferase involved in cell wall biosynthesis